MSDDRTPDRVAPHAASRLREGHAECRQQHVAPLHAEQRSRVAPM